jgi:hypothetical protein
MNNNVTKTKFFIAINGQDFTRIDQNDLYVEVKAGNVFKDSYVFDEDADRWVHLISHPMIPSLIKNEALFCPDKVEVPDFKPKDEVVIKEVGHVDGKIVNLLDTKLSQIDTKIKEFQRPLSVENDFSEISDKIQNLEKNIKENIAQTNEETTQKNIEVVEQFSKNIIDLKDEVKNTKTPSIDKDEVKTLFDELTAKVTEAVNNQETNIDIDLSDLERMKDSINSLMEANKGLVTYLETKSKDDDHNSATLTRIEKYLKSVDGKIDDHGESSKTHQDKFDKLYVKYKNQVMENKVLKGKLDKAVKKMNILHNRVNEMSVVAQEVQAPQPSLEELVEAPVGEAAKIIEMAKPVAQPVVDEDYEEILGVDDLKNGKSYEIDNKAKWMIDNGEGVLGPYRFDQMLKLKSTGKVNSESLIKIQGKGAWKSLVDFLELTAESKILKEDKQSPEDSIYLIERSEYRAEVHELVNFTIDDVEHKGYLTNVSLGGGFIEVTRLDEEVYTRGAKVTLYLSGPGFSESIVCDLDIKRVSKQRPKGFGFTFENNSEKNLEVLGQFIVDHISGSKKPGSSAA